MAEEVDFDAVFAALEPSLEAIKKNSALLDLEKPLSSSLRSPLEGKEAAYIAQKQGTSKAFFEDETEHRVASKAVISAATEKDLVAPTAKQTKRNKGVAKQDTTGWRWFDMPAGEVTTELLPDLKLLKMRDVLDRKRHYKAPDSSKLPKYFQVGQVIDGAADFYSSSSTRKERKKRLVDELLEDAEKRKYNKRKYVELSKNKYDRNSKSRKNNKKLRTKSKQPVYDVK